MLLHPTPSGGGLIQTDRKSAESPQIFNIPVSATFATSTSNQQLGNRFGVGPSRAPLSSAGATLQVVETLSQNPDFTVNMNDDKSGFVVGSSVPVDTQGHFRENHFQSPSPSQRPSYQQSPPATTMAPLTHSYRPVSAVPVSNSIRPVGAGVSPASYSVTTGPVNGLWHPSPSPTIFRHLVQKEKLEELKKHNRPKPSTRPLGAGRERRSMPSSMPRRYTRAKCRISVSACLSRHPL